MTRLVDVHDMCDLINRIGTGEYIRKLTAYIEQDFLRWEQFDKTARVANHSPEGVIELMPVSDDTLYSFKYVNGHPKNASSNQLTVMSFASLAEVSTGYPVLLSEFTLSTALRTAATSVLAAKYLARPGSRCMAVIGNGAQSEFQIIGFSQVLGISEFRLYDTDPAATDKLVSNLADYPGIRLHFCHSVDEALRGADIITTVTADKTNATIIRRDQISPGCHINAVGGDCPGKTELDPAILSDADVYVEFIPQTRIEGEIQQMPDDFSVTEVWEVIAGKHPGRKRFESITVFDSVGFAIEDFSGLRLLNDLCFEHSTGKELALVPQPDDPRNLFGLIRDGARP